jgi:hypothetical protein
VLPGSGERAGLQESEEVGRAEKEQAGLTWRAGERKLGRFRWASRKRRERECGLGSRKDWADFRIQVFSFSFFFSSPNTLN